MHPGQRNSLDALCKRYFVDDSQRDLHGALLDAEILADVYLAMTGGQTALALDTDDGGQGYGADASAKFVGRPGLLPVVRASAEELDAHEARLDALDKASDGAVWRRDLSVH
jgi:DNA polymerase III subunit epsilon